MAQPFFSLDADKQEPLCLTLASSARVITPATRELLVLAAAILKDDGRRPRGLADNEHYRVELFDWISSDSPFDLLTPMPYNASVRRAIQGLPPEAFKRHWAGYATAKQRYSLTRSLGGPYYHFIQPKGEQEQDYDFQAFLCTTDRDEMEDLSRTYPQRWHVEEFFKNDQALG